MSLTKASIGLICLATILSDVLFVGSEEPQGYHHASSYESNFASSKSFSSGDQALGASQNYPIVHTQATYKGCSSSTGCGGVSLENGKVVEKFGNSAAIGLSGAAPEAFNAAELHKKFAEKASEVSPQFTGNLPAGGPFWWANADSPFKNVHDTYMKWIKEGFNGPSFQSPCTACAISNSFPSNNNLNLDASSIGSNSIDISKNPFLNGKFSSESSSGPVGFNKPTTSSIDISKNPFLNGDIKVPGSHFGSSLQPLLPSNVNKLSESGTGINFSNNPFFSGVTNTFSSTGCAGGQNCNQQPNGQHLGGPFTTGKPFTSQNTQQGSDYYQGQKQTQISQQSSCTGAYCGQQKPLANKPNQQSNSPQDENAYQVTPCVGTGCNYQNQQQIGNQNVYQSPCTGPSCNPQKPSSANHNSFGSTTQQQNTDYYQSQTQAQNSQHSSCTGAFCNQQKPSSNTNKPIQQSSVPQDENAYQVTPCIGAACNNQKQQGKPNQFTQPAGCTGQFCNQGSSLPSQSTTTNYQQQSISTSNSQFNNPQTNDKFNQNQRPNQFTQQSNVHQDENAYEVTPCVGAACNNKKQQGKPNQFTQPAGCTGQFCNQGKPTSPHSTVNEQRFTTPIGQFNTNNQYAVENDDQYQQNQEQSYDQFFQQPICTGESCDNKKTSDKPYSTPNLSPPPSTSFVPHPPGATAGEFKPPTGNVNGELTVSCTGIERVCAPKHICINGYIEDNDANRSQIRKGVVTECKTNQEICCRWKSKPINSGSLVDSVPGQSLVSSNVVSAPGNYPQPNSFLQPGSQQSSGLTFIPGSKSDSFGQNSFDDSFYVRPGSGSVLKPGIPYLPPVEQSTKFQTQRTTVYQPPVTQRTTVYRPPVTQRTTVYRPPVTTTYRPQTAPPYVPPSTYATRRTTLPPYIPPKASTSPPYLPPKEDESPQPSSGSQQIVPGPGDSEGSLLLDNTRNPPTKDSPLIPTACAAALKCTAIEFCTAEGVISNTSVLLTKEQQDFRVPLTDCKDVETGIVGKCCRDSTYTDPWPTNQLGQWVPGAFGDTGAYRADQYRNGGRKPATSSNGSPGNGFGPGARPESSINTPIFASHPNHSIKPNNFNNNFQNTKTPPKQPNNYFPSNTNIRPVLGVQTTPNIPNNPTYTPGVQNNPNYTPGTQNNPTYTPGVQNNPTYTPGIQKNPSYTPGVQKNPTYTPGIQNNPTYTSGIQNNPTYSSGQSQLSNFNSAESCGIRKKPGYPAGNRDQLEVDFGEIPWQAMVLLQTNKSLLCGGVITAPDAVVTSAHCVDGLDAKNVLIKGGEWKLGIDEEPKPFQIVQVSKIIKHPGYEPNNLQYDMAVLLLAEKLRFADHINSLCLPPVNRNEQSLYNKRTQCIATGWGKKVLQVHIPSSIMHSVDMSIIPPNQCQAQITQNYPHLSELYNPNTCICGQPTNPTANICKIDIGSALACTNADGTYYMEGVYSWDSGCTSPNQIASFFKFDTTWYESTMEAVGSQSQLHETYTKNKQSELPSQNQNFNSPNSFQGQNYNPNIQRHFTNQSPASSRHKEFQQVIGHTHTDQCQCN